MYVSGYSQSENSNMLSFEATLFEDMKVRKNNDKCTVWNLKFPSKEKKSTWLNKCTVLRKRLKNSYQTCFPLHYFPYLCLLNN